MGVVVPVLGRLREALILIGVRVSTGGSFLVERVLLFLSDVLSQCSSLKSWKRRGLYVLTY